MTEEAKRIVDALRMCPDPGFGCNDCPVYTPGRTCQNELKAADLIEFLSADLERVTKERDAAVKHLLECHKTICPTCIHHTGAGCDKNANAGVDEAVIFCADYEWCGFVR